MSFHYLSDCEHSSCKKICQLGPCFVTKKVNLQKQEEQCDIESEEQSQLNVLKFHIKNSQYRSKSSNIEDLVRKIEKTPKTQINQISKLFLQLSFSLSLDSKKICKISPSKRFLLNFAQFLKRIREEQSINKQNMAKINRILFNSLLYILVLIISGDKQNNKNEDLKKKIFENTKFINTFLALDIHKSRKVSKLYGNILVYIYKNCSASKVKRNLVRSIHRNLRHVDHDKTSLNLIMILNQYRNSIKVRLSQIKQTNLVEEVHKVYVQNKGSYQSMYALSYYLHLVYNYPTVSNAHFSQQLKIFELTEDIKRLILTYNVFEKTFLRCMAYICEKSSSKQRIQILEYYFKKFCQNMDTLMDSNTKRKWTYFLLQSMQMLFAGICSEHDVLGVLELGFLLKLTQCLSNNIDQTDIVQKIRDIGLGLCVKLQEHQSKLSLSILKYLNYQMFKKYAYAEQVLTRRQNIVQKMVQSNIDHPKVEMELE